MQLLSFQVKIFSRNRTFFSWIRASLKQAIYAGRRAQWFSHSLTVEKKGLGRKETVPTQVSNSCR